MSKQEDPSQEDVLKAALDTEEKECRPDVKCDPGNKSSGGPLARLFDTGECICDYE